MLKFRFNTEINSFTNINSRYFNVIITFLWLTAWVFDENFITFWFLRNISTYLNIFHNLSFYNPSNGFFSVWNVTFQLFITLNQLLLLLFLNLLVFDFSTYFFNIGLIFDFQMFNDGLKLIDFDLEFSDVFFFINAFLNFDFKMFRRSV